MMNKKLLAFGCLVVMSVVTVANAQFFRVRELPRHDISLSMSVSDFEPALFSKSHFGSCPSIQRSGVSGDVIELSYDGLAGGSANLSYLYNLNNRLGVGLQFSYLETLEEVTARWDNSHYSHSLLAERECSAFCVMPSARWYWWNYNHFGCYTRVAAGIGFLRENEKDKNLHDDIDFTCEKRKSAKFAYQLSGLGLEWGGSLIRGFAEGGYGVQGYITIGVKATL